LLPILTPEQRFSLSALVTALAFFGIGMIKGLILQRPVFKAGLETLFIGGVAAGLAYLVGVWLRQTFGVD
jgi:VIT1/CCC1 family predicted Fe2+/Mn2+ transporter